jgi:DNA polymerase (family 10)
MAQGCIERGYTYMAITDHSKAVTVARGLTTQRLAQQWKEIERVRRRLPGFALLRGMEVDILQDGSLDLPDAWLQQLDLVVVSVHSHMNLSKPQMTGRVCHALQHPCVDILAHPTGRIINERAAYDIDMDAVLRAAAEYDVAVELNAQPHRLDLNDVLVRRAKELGVRIAINTDAHGVESLDFMACGIDQARRGWLEKSDVLNAMPVARLRKWLERRRRGGRTRARDT